MDQLYLNSKDFLKNLYTALDICGGTLNAEALISFDGHNASFSIPSVEFFVPATGAFTQQIRIPAQFMRTVYYSNVDDVDGGPIVMTLDGGKLTVEDMSTRCIINEITTAVIPLPPDPSPTDLLKTAYSYSVDELERAGLSELTIGAVALRDRQIKKAFRELRCFRVTAKELRELVDKKVGKMKR